MIKFLNKVAERYSDIFKVFLFIVSVGLIVLQFPKEGKFKYEFFEGKPWMHEDLIAQFDFPILKSEYELNVDRNNLIENAKTYYSYNTKIKDEKRKYFINEFEKNWLEKFGSTEKKQKKINLNTGLSILDTIYNRGVIRLDDTIENKSGNFIVNIVTGNISEEKELSEIFTIQSAYDYIVSALASKPAANKDFLLRLLENSIEQNIFINSELTRKYKENLVSGISLYHGLTQKGERIISKGELITPAKYKIIESMKSEYEAQLSSSANYFGLLSGQIILICLSHIVLIFFLLSFRRDVLIDNKKVFFILLNIFIMVWVISRVVRIDSSYLYLVPLCIVPVIIRAFFDTRIALFVYLVTIIITGFLVPNSFEFVFLQLIAGIMAIVSVANLKKRSQFFITCILVFVTYSATYTGMTLMQEGNLAGIKLNTFLSFAGSSLLILFSYPLIFIYEKIFGFVTDVSLMELSDTNSPLLRELSLKAPSTLQHSLQVANLAEEAVYAIGGNTLLIRAGALYHDIGKMEMPLYFTENQGSGINPHEELTSVESASIIISHVIKGVELAKKYNIPERIIDFIRTHHGTRRTQYFYQQFIRNNPTDTPDESKFRYRGPLPFSKESAVLMMADAVEAVSRTLKKPDEDAINNMVEEVINIQVEQKQFVNADITFRDIALIKKIFKKKLQNMFHVRIEYPS